MYHWLITSYVPRLSLEVSMKVFPLTVLLPKIGRSPGPCLDPFFALFVLA